MKDLEARVYGLFRLFVLIGFVACVAIGMLLGMSGCANPIERHLAGTAFESAPYSVREIYTPALEPAAWTLEDAGGQFVAHIGDIRFRPGHPGEQMEEYRLAVARARRDIADEILRRIEAAPFPEVP